MLALLVAGGAIYLLLGDLREALILLAFAGMSVLITVVQEARTERVLEALRDLTSPRAVVIRSGRRQRIAGREVVRGDLVLLGEGDRVPADARLMQGNDLRVDESLLTGESMPVAKEAADPRCADQSRADPDRAHHVYSGSLIVAGSGMAEVVATGAQSEIGRIGRMLRDLEPEPSRLQAQTRRLVRLFFVVGILVSSLAVILYGVTRGSWIEALLAGIAIGMSMLPEEFPVVLTVFMAMGAWRISRARVLTRKAAAIETLGAASVLCTDKTGTLTENRMSVVQLRRPGSDPLHLRNNPGTLAGGFSDMALAGLLASAPELFDPMEVAFHDLGREPAERSGALPERGWKLLRRYGLRPELLAVTQVWQSPENASNLVVATKGAPEAIASLCRLSPPDRTEIRNCTVEMATEGLRVLALAKATHAGADLPDSPQAFQFEFLGLAGLADPLRPSVPGAIEHCRCAGIRVIMITGDHPATAQAIARQAGLDAGQVLSGSDLEGLGDGELGARLANASVFARIMPEQKLRIVQALKAAGETVAMTGDGVNDAPSLKAAHIGVAMGRRGTDVAREASSIVLLDDDFGSIVKAIRLGRRIYDNLRKAMGFIFAVHVPIAGLALLPLVFGLPIIFSPIHIAFLELIIDPVCSLAFEAEIEERDVMERPPRPAREPLFSAALIGWSLLQGLVAFAVVTALFLFALDSGRPENEARALTILALVLGTISLILVNRSYSASLVTAFRRPNQALAWMLAVVILIMAATLTVPSVRALFRFGPLHGSDLLLAFGAGTSILLILELLKPLWRQRLRA